MNTKLSQIEKSLKLKYRLENNPGSDPHGGTGGVGGQAMRAPSAGGGVPAGMGGGDGSGFGHPRNRENEQLVEELHRYNSVLLRENSDLKTKIKVMEACRTPYNSRRPFRCTWMVAMYSLDCRRLVAMRVYHKIHHRHKSFIAPECGFVNAAPPAWCT